MKRVGKVWMAASNVKFVEVTAANRSAECMGAMMEQAGAEVELVLGGRDRRGVSPTTVRQRVQLSRRRRIAGLPVGPFERMAEYGVSVVGMAVAG